LFADASWRVSAPLLLSAAARLDHWRLGDGTLREFDLATGATTLESPSTARDGLEPSGRLGLLWRPLPAVRVRAAGYHGWRLPTLNELHRPFRAGQDATAANPALSPERLNGIEASLGWQPLESIDISATLFANRLLDPIANVTLASGPGVFPGVGFIPAGGRYRQRQNLDAIESRGLEADARLGWGKMSLSASAAYVDAQVEGGGLGGLRPAQAPEFSGSLGGAWRADNAELGATLRYLGPRFEDDQNSRRLPAATTLDAEAALRVASRLWATLSVENLTDARIATGFSSDQYERGQPRTVWLGLRVSAAGS
jgi:outer membrane receptor protein involved in Fe transport